MTDQILPKSSFTLRWLKRLTLLVLTISTATGLAVFALYKQIEPELPSIDVLRDVKFQIPLTVYSHDGKLIGQFGEKKRIPVHFADTPPRLIEALLAAEDDRFFEHPGVDYQGLARAAAQLALTGEKRQGGSTITMQVARNFFLSREKTFLRKFKEIFLSLKIERELSKEEILELYLNKIYLGHRSYGIGAAAQVYYGKNLSELNLAQWAMIAGLPKAPSRYNPITNPERALNRRNYVLRRMLELQHITEAEYKATISEAVSAKLHGASIESEAPYIAEMVRERMVQDYGTDAYSEGYKVFTTLDSGLQAAATHALQKTLHDYDERHGYRGAESQIPGNPEEPEQWQAILKTIPPIGDTIPALVLSAEEQSIKVFSLATSIIQLNWDDLKWARKFISHNSRGARPKKASDIVQAGNIIRIRESEPKHWVLAQIPEPQGALVSLAPSDGAILALVGGFDFYQSKYNRATQSQRQPGSGFKPVLYTAALEQGFTAASIINDAPVVFDDPSQETEWRPENYSGKFFGPTRLRVALRKSRNLVSVRLMRELGIASVIESALRFGFNAEQLPRTLSLALGSGTASPLDMVRFYATFANGGFLITPYFIERIENSEGDIIWQATPQTACLSCAETDSPTSAPRVISPRIHYLMNSLLQDVIRQGTAVKARQLGRSDLAGKTGTTNDQRDAWFNGYSPALVATAWVGMDSSRPLGHQETGSRAALPMWIDFMRTALINIPEIQFDKPDGIHSVRIDPITGLLAPPDSEEAIFEIFRSEYIPDHFAGGKDHSPATAGSGASQIQSLF